MSISDETLMAFLDGELLGAERAAVEGAIRENPELGKRVAQHRALSDRISLAYAAELAEPVPDRLLAAARGAGGSPTNAKIVKLSDARAAVARERAMEDSRAAKDEWSVKNSWRSLGGIAAGVLLGLGLGYGVWQRGDVLIARDAGGAMIAGGQLKSALTAQLTPEQSPASRVHIGISFRDKSGEYCRSFVLSGAAAPVGFACRQGADWHIQSLVTGQNGETGGAYRTAGSEMPPLLLKSIEAQIAGEPLDQAGEAAAREQGWQSPVH